MNAFKKLFTSANSNLIVFFGKIGACISGKTNENEMTTILKVTSFDQKDQKSDLFKHVIVKASQRYRT